jgi:hypothetical protein
MGASLPCPGLGIVYPGNTNSVLEAGLYVALALVAVFAVEAFLSSRWLPSYFRSGLILFSKRIEAPAPEPSGLPHAIQLEFEMRSALTSPLLFRTLSPGEIAFREELFEMRLLGYSPLMHGHIEARPTDQSVFVRGRLNWSSLVLFVSLALFLHGRELYEFMALLVAAFVSLYAIQAYRFRQVGDVVAEAVGTRR